VLRDVTLGNLRYFRELLAGSEEGIASNILADRLKRLVSVGLLTVRTRGRDGGRRTA
jgi:DNA-binding HxlR family transcriptional regulator